ncbi:MAG: ATP-grasp domain-containing protein [Clostridia bacterium]|nr:ATP-grasp domain-containing protein [Clostridia bacterium]
MKKRVLILNCGTLASTDINMSLRYNDEFEIWGASTNKNHGVYVYEKYIDDIPNISDENFIKILNQKIEEYDFKFIFAPHEDLALFMQEHKDEINATIVCSEYETALLCRYKSKTYEKMKEYDFIPKTFKKDEVEEYPVFVKKDNDQGGRHAYKVQNREELELYAASDDMIICEFLPGEEVTIDCFTNKNGKLLYCNPRAADRMLAGIDVHARRIELSDEIKYIAESLNKEIKFRGFWFFQIKKDINGKFKLLEIATRLAGAFALNKSLDVNLPLMALKDFDGQDVEILFNDIKVEVDKQFFSKFLMDIEYEEVYIDFESCFENIKIINTLLIMYIYQCVNKNKKITLVTDDENIDLLLEEKKINKNVFSKIIKFNNLEDTINNKAIFISNNEKLKNELRKQKNIYCFSTNSIEALIDWKA